MLSICRLVVVAITDKASTSLSFTSVSGRTYCALIKISPDDLTSLFGALLPALTMI